VQQDGKKGIDTGFKKPGHSRAWRVGRGVWKRGNATNSSSGDLGYKHGRSLLLCESLDKMLLEYPY
jgi:hypothetical protein